MELEYMELECLDHSDVDYLELFFGSLNQISPSMGLPAKSLANPSTEDLSYLEWKRDKYINEGLSTVALDKQIELLKYCKHDVEYTSSMPLINFHGEPEVFTVDL